MQRFLKGKSNHLSLRGFKINKVGISEVQLYKNDFNKRFVIKVHQNRVKNNTSRVTITNYNKVYGGKTGFGHRFWIILKQAVLKIIDTIRFQVRYDIQ